MEGEKLEAPPGTLVYTPAALGGLVVAYAVARLDEIDTLLDMGYHYRPVRHHFGITSFGVTAWVGRCGG